MLIEKKLKDLLGRRVYRVMEEVDIISNVDSTLYLTYQEAAEAIADNGVVGHVCSNRVGMVGVYLKDDQTHSKVFLDNDLIIIENDEDMKKDAESIVSVQSEENPYSIIALDTSTAIACARDRNITLYAIVPKTTHDILYPQTDLKRVESFVRLNDPKGTMVNIHEIIIDDVTRSSILEETYIVKDICIFDTGGLYMLGIVGKPISLDSQEEISV